MVAIPRPLLVLRSHASLVKLDGHASQKQQMENLMFDAVNVISTAELHYYAVVSNADAAMMDASTIKELAKQHPYWIHCILQGNKFLFDICDLNMSTYSIICTKSSDPTGFLQSRSIHSVKTHLHLANSNAIQ
jgi:hypothetical protein